MGTFFNSYKVIIFGVISAIILAVTELAGSGTANIKVLIYAAAMAALSFLANNLRGQVATIIGIVLTSFATFITMEQNGNISWTQLVLSLLAALLGIFTPPAKSIGYESAPAIIEAKQEGEAITPSTATVQ